MVNVSSANLSPAAGYEPTLGQRLIIESVRRFGLGNGAARLYGAKAVGKLRAGPVDYDYHGLVLRIDPTRCGSARHMLMTPNWTDARERAFLAKHLPEDGSFIDAGANVGFYTFYAAGVRPRARIVAFEASAALAHEINDNAVRNGLARVTIDPRGLSDIEGMSEVEGSLVPTTTLVNAMAAHNIERIDVLKIDIEGMEDRVLLPFFESAPVSQWPKAMLVEHIFANRCIDFAKANGYREEWRNGFNAALVRDR